MRPPNLLSKTRGIKSPFFFASCCIMKRRVVISKMNVRLKKEVQGSDFKEVCKALCFYRNFLVVDTKNKVQYRTEDGSYQELPENAIITTTISFS